MAEEQFDYDGFLFSIREIECEVKVIDAQVDKLKLERDKLMYELGSLDALYTDHINQSKPEDPVPEESKEVLKLKKLKKPNDKPSENNTEVQLQEGRS